VDADLCYRTLTDTAGALRRREISPVELARVVLARIDHLEPQLHSYLTVLPERALERASVAERELAAGIDRGLLHGIPIAVKDLCFTKGIPTTCASGVLAGWIPSIDATVVERLEAAGAVLLGKLNMTEFAMSGYAPSLPIPRNPWDPARHTGGSSSGSGVATAAGLCFASLGTDTGGSIRNPSAWCGVVGLKPTYGRVSRHGIFPLGMTLDHVGPMTRSVADAAAVLQVIAGEDANDPTSLAAPVPECSAVLTRGVRGVRIGVDEHYMGEYVHPDVVTALFAALDVLKRLGAAVVPVVDRTPAAERQGHEAPAPAAVHRVEENVAPPTALQPDVQQRVRAAGGVELDPLADVAASIDRALEPGVGALHGPEQRGGDPGPVAVESGDRAGDGAGGRAAADRRPVPRVERRDVELVAGPVVKLPRQGRARVDADRQRHGDGSGRKGEAGEA